MRNRRDPRKYEKLFQPWERRKNPDFIYFDIFKGVLVDEYKYRIHLKYGSIRIVRVPVLADYICKTFELSSTQKAWIIYFGKKKKFVYSMSEELYKQVVVFKTLKALKGGPTHDI